MTPENAIEQPASIVSFISLIIFATVDLSELGALKLMTLAKKNFLCIFLRRVKHLGS
jgi:hypothetical protein